MKYLLLALVVATSAHADWVAQEGQNRARLTELPCEFEPVVKQLPPEQVRDYRAAIVTYEGKNYNACWTATRSGAYLVYEDGDRGEISRDLIRPAVET